MDRFIVNPFSSLNAFSFSLKSNMDRFIACMCEGVQRSHWNLKSNMDRFIGVAWFCIIANLHI